MGNQTSFLENMRRPRISFRGSDVSIDHALRQLKEEKAQLKLEIRREKKLRQQLLQEMKSKEKEFTLLSNYMNKMRGDYQVVYEKTNYGFETGSAPVTVECKRGVSKRLNNTYQRAEVVQEETDWM